MNVFLMAIQGALYLFGIYMLLVAMCGLWVKKTRKQYQPRIRFAVIVPAHNEEKVLGKLLSNLEQLDYPKSLYDIYVIADNCTDNTAAIAANKKVAVMERFHKHLKGKGHALEFAFDRLGFTSPLSECGYDAVAVFDADNLVAANYLKVMNNRILSGEKLIQCFIDSKNPDDSWITSAFSITFWLNNRFAMQARSNIGLCAALAGTGMCISAGVLKKIGWATSTLTEDLEYSIKALLHGYRTTFAYETRIFDEKPLSLYASCRQRLRWARGQINVALKYIPLLLCRGVRERNLVKVEGALRLFQLFVIVLGGAMLLTAMLTPVPAFFNLFNFSPGSYVPSLLLALPNIPLILPFFILVLDSPPLKSFRFLPLFPVFSYMWIFLIIIAIFTFRNKSWMPTIHTRDMDHISMGVFNGTVPPEKEPETGGIVPLNPNKDQSFPTSIPSRAVRRARA